MCLISLCHKTVVLVQYCTYLRQKAEEKEAYKMHILIRNTNNAHKISLQSFVSLYRRLRYSYCMIVHIIDDNKKKNNTSHA